MSLRQPTFTRLLFKVFAVLDVGRCQFNRILFLFSLSTVAFFFFSTISCMYGSEGMIINKLHDMLGLFILLSNEIFLFINQSQVNTMLTFLVEPFEKSKRSNIHSNIVQRYKREINFYFVVFPTFIVVFVLAWLTTSLVVMNMTTSFGNEKCFRLSYGWVWISEFDLYLIFLNTVCAALSIFRLYLVVMAMLAAIIKIKFKFRLLCADFEAADEFLNQSGEKLETNVSTVESASRTKYTSNDNNYEVNLARILQGIEEENKVADLDLLKYSREKMKKEKVKSYLKNLVEQHVDIIEKVKLTNKNFMLTVMVFHQIAIIHLALAVPNISLNNEVGIIEYIYQGGEVSFTLMILGCFNYLGQILLDESESLRQALYSCDWTDMPPSVRQGLLIMMIVATKPFKLTIGGIYTLGMETYSNVFNAAYSYTSFIQSQNA